VDAFVGGWCSRRLWGGDGDFVIKWDFRGLDEGFVSGFQNLDLKRIDGGGQGRKRVCLDLNPFL